MTKATIITDAISYIEQLQTSVKELSDQLLQLDANCVNKGKAKSEEVDSEQDTNNWEVTV